MKNRLHMVKALSWFAALAVAAVVASCGTTSGATSTDAGEVQPFRVDDLSGRPVDLGRSRTGQTFATPLLGIPRFALSGLPRRGLGRSGQTLFAP